MKYRSTRTPPVARSTSTWPRCTPYGYVIGASTNVRAAVSPGSSPRRPALAASQAAAIPASVTRRSGEPATPAWPSSRGMSGGGGGGAGDDRVALLEADVGRGGLEQIAGDLAGAPRRRLRGDTDRAARED